jgi:hypothetical protein
MHVTRPCASQGSQGCPHPGRRCDPVQVWSAPEAIRIGPEMRAPYLTHVRRRFTGGAMMSLQRNLVTRSMPLRAEGEPDAQAKEAIENSESLAAISGKIPQKVHFPSHWGVSRALHAFGLPSTAQTLVLKLPPCPPAHQTPPSRHSSPDHGSRRPGHGP